MGRSTFDPDQPYSADNPRSGLPVRDDWPEVRRFLLWVIAVCFILLALICGIGRWVKINHELEREFAERYSVSNVDVAAGGTDVTWTNTEGTHRCTGRWVEGDLVIRFCWQILPPAQPAER